MKPQSLLTRQLLQNADFSFDSMWKCPRYVRTASKGLVHEPDVLTPLKKGKEWLFEYTKRFQPKTADHLLNGSKLFVCGEMPGVIPLMSLYIEVNGFLLVIGVGSPSQTPDNPAHISENRDNRYLSLPTDLSKSYYHRFDGLGIEWHPSPLGSGKHLPSRSGAAWVPASGLMARYHLRKKLLPILKEKIPSLAYETKNPPPGWGTKFMCFLQTPPTNGSHRKFDALFVKTHIQDGTIYLLHDLDVDNLMILDNPAEAIDSYNAHILSREEGRFDFRQYGRKI